MHFNFRSNLNCKLPMNIKTSKGKQAIINFITNFFIKTKIVLAGWESAPPTIGSIAEKKQAMLGNDKIKRGPCKFVSWSLKIQIMIVSS